VGSPGRPAAGQGGASSTGGGGGLGQKDPGVGCAGDLDRLVKRERREREATGESLVDQQARIERAYWELRRSARPGEGAGP